MGFLTVIIITYVLPSFVLKLVSIWQSLNRSILTFLYPTVTNITTFLHHLVSAQVGYLQQSVSILH